MNSSQNPITVMSFDPGSNHTRYAILTGTRHEQTFVTSGTEPSDAQALEQLIKTAMLEHNITHFAVETTGRFAPHPKIVLALLDTAEIAGILIGLTTATGRTVFTLPANAPKGKTSWRVMLCGARYGTHANDDTVRAYLRMILPSLPERTNVHVRDAAGLGVVAMRCAQNPEPLVIDYQEIVPSKLEHISLKIGKITPPAPKRSRPVRCRCGIKK